MRLGNIKIVLSPPTTVPIKFSGGVLIFVIVVTMLPSNFIGKL